MNNKPSSTAKQPSVHMQGICLRSRKQIPNTQPGLADPGAELSWMTDRRGQRPHSQDAHRPRTDFVYFSHTPICFVAQETAGKCIVRQAALCFGAKRLFAPDSGQKRVGFGPGPAAAASKPITCCIIRRAGLCFGVKRPFAPGSRQKGWVKPQRLVN